MFSTATQKNILTLLYHHRYAFGHVSRLRLTDIDHEFDGTRSVNIVTFLQGFPNLQRLCFGDIRIDDVDTFAHEKPVFPMLKELKVEQSDKNEAAVELINEIIDVNSVHLHSMNVGRHVDVRIPRSWPNLTRLVVTDNALQAKWLFVKIPYLQHLHVKYETLQSHTIYLHVVLSAIRKWRATLKTLQIDVYPMDLIQILEDCLRSNEYTALDVIINAEFVSEDTIRESAWNFLA